MSDPTPSNPGRAALPAGGPAASSGIAVSDLWYLLFRRKWLILGFLVAGILAAAVAFRAERPLFFSECKLFVRYVIETKSMEVGADGQVRAPSGTAETIINSELEILTSRDLCQQVAAAVGPEKILAKVGGGSNLTMAANVISKGLAVEVPRKSSVIRIRLSHPDPGVVQSALDELVDSYFKRHREIHRAVGSVDTILSQQADQLRSRLMDTEKELRTLKSKVGIISVPDAKKAWAEQMTAVRNLLLAAEAELAEQGGGSHLVATNRSTNGIVPLVLSNALVRGSSTNQPVAGPPPEKLAEYRTVSRHLEALRIREWESRDTFAPEGRFMTRLREQIEENEKTKKNLELEFPPLCNVAVSALAAGSSDFGLTFNTNRSRALGAKINFLNAELQRIRTEILAVEEEEGMISQLQRKQELEEKNYRYFMAGLEQARFDEALGAGRLANIATAQAPSPAARSSATRLKVAGLILAGAVLSGFGLAFLLELVLDQTVRRPFHIEKRLHLPLFSCIPRLRLNGSHRRSLAGNGREELSDGGTEAAPASSLAEWTQSHPFRPHLESLRDRILMLFEGDPRRPKLIGLTSCGEGAGVSTLAVGLAAALSETGDGNVLLLNLALGGQSIHPYFNGKPACGLEDVLENRETGLISQNLYMASAKANGENGLEILPRSLTRVVPRLKASDYDYVIVDLPRISRASITPKLAGMMDLVLMVVESEKQSQDMVKAAAGLMLGSKAPVSVVLNKFRSFVPKWLHTEI